MRDVQSFTRIERRHLRALHRTSVRTLRTSSCIYSMCECPIPPASECLSLTSAVEGSCTKPSSVGRSDGRSCGRVGFYPGFIHYPGFRERERERERESPPSLFSFPAKHIFHTIQNITKKRRDASHSILIYLTTLRTHSGLKNVRYPRKRSIAFAKKIQGRVFKEIEGRRIPVKTSAREI